MGIYVTETTDVKTSPCQAALNARQLRLAVELQLPLRAALLMGPALR